MPDTGSQETAEGLPPSSPPQVTHAVVQRGCLQKRWRQKTSRCCTPKLWERKHGVTCVPTEATPPLLQNHKGLANWLFPFGGDKLSGAQEVILKAQKGQSLLLFDKKYSLFPGVL